MSILHFLNDFSMIAPFLIKSVVLFVLIGLSSIIVNKLTFHEPEDDEE